MALTHRHAGLAIRVSALLLLAFAQLAFAANITNEVGYYKNPNEIVGIVDVTVDGTLYHLVRINGVESLVLKPEAEEFAQVKDEPTITKIVSKYTSDHIDELVDATRVTTLTSDFDKAYSSALFCTEGSYAIVRQGGILKAILAKFLGDAGFMTSTPGSKGYYIDMLNKTHYEMNRTLGEARNLSLALADKSLLADADKLYSQVDQLSSKTSEIKAITPGYLSNYSSLYAYASYYFHHKRACNFSTTLLDTVINDAAFKEQLPRISTIVAQIKSKTEQRGDTALIRKMIETKEKNYALFTALKEAVAAKTAAMGITISTIEEKAKAMKESLDSLKSSTTVVAATEAEKSFNQAYNDGYAELTELNQSTLLVDAAMAINKTADAREQVQNASARLGAIPETDALKARYEILKQGLDAKIAALQAGSNNTVSADFRALGQEAAQLETDALTTQPSWQKISPELIVGALLVIAVVGGGVVYYRSAKKKIEASPMTFNKVEKQ